MTLGVSRAVTLLALMLPAFAGAEGPTAAEQLADLTPDRLLRQVSAAVHDATYSGTLVRSSNGSMATMQVWHRNDDGFVREKLVNLDGESREVLRHGDELICLLPKRRLKLVDSAAGDSNAFVRLPETNGVIDRFYTLERGPDMRLADRQAYTFFVRPRDRFRYGYRLWTDAETFLPLRMQLMNGRKVVEEIRFAAISVGTPIADETFISNIDSTGFEVSYVDSQSAEDLPPETNTVIAKQRARAPASAEATAVPAMANSLVATGAPARRGSAVGGVRWPAEPASGFKLGKDQSQTVVVNGRVAQRYVFTDGLAIVSVFISIVDGDAFEGSKASRFGAVHSYRTRVGDRVITLVGEVPVETLQRIAGQAELAALPQPEVAGDTE
ncbi:MAG: MucB/RseB C-terminal domain-containing protein [Pseudomonadota bacterium]